MSQAQDIVKLKQLLEEKFPAAHARRPEQETVPTGVRLLDDVGLPKGAITEVVSEGTSTGGHLLISELIEQFQKNRQTLALVDGANSFDPQTAMPDGAERLLWVRCQKAMEAIQSTDILLRDGNLRFVVLDLCLNGQKELRRLNSAVWFRLQTLAQQTSSVLMVMTPQTLVGCARLRLKLDSQFRLQDLNRRPGQLLNKVRIRVTRQRSGKLQVGVDVEEQGRLAS